MIKLEDTHQHCITYYLILILYFCFLNAFKQDKNQHLTLKGIKVRMQTNLLSREM